VSGLVRTLFSDLDPAELGMVYAHEHLVINSPFIASAFPHILLDDVGAAVAEARECAQAGVKVMVDAMPCAAGRDVEALAQVSRLSGVHIVGSTGLHHVRYYGARHWSGQLATEELAELFVAELVEGIDRFDYTGPVVRRAGYRAGVVKVGTGEAPTPRDRRVLEAAALAHRLTGAPILTHCEGGLGALEQIALLGEGGVPTSSIICSHVDKVPSLRYQMDIASTGAFLEYDQALRQVGSEQLTTVGLVVSMVAEGFGGQILVGTDGARRELWHHLGGRPGLAWLAERLPKLLVERGLTAEQVQAIFVANPARAFAMRPVAGRPERPEGAQRPATPQTEPVPRRGTSTDQAQLDN
jgi:predicted metal-dependent phosphotriesterase family hydrolase